MSEAVEINLGSVGDPAVSTGHIVRVRGLVDAVVGGAMDLQTELRQGGSALSTPAVWNDALTASGQTFEHTLSGAQADAITDYSTLRLLFTATQAAPGAPTYFGAGTAVFTATNTATLTPTLPTGWAADDIHVLLAHRSDNTAMTTLSGWTQLAALSGNNTAAQRVEVWWRRAVGGDGDPVVTFGSGTIVRGARIYGVRGCVTTGSPFDTGTGAPTSSPNAASATITFTDLTTLGPALVLALAAYEDDPSARTTMTNWTQPTTPISTSNLGTDMSLNVQWRSLAAAGAAGATTQTVSGGSFADSVNVGLVLALIPANASRARITWAELQVPVAAAVQDAPELRGPSGLRAARQMHQLLAT